MRPDEQYKLSMCL